MTMLTPLIQVVIGHILAPILLFVPLWRRQANRWESLLVASTAAAYTAAFFQIGRWDMIGYWARGLVVLLFAASAVRWWQLSKRYPPIGRRLSLSHAVYAVLLVFFTSMAVLAASGRTSRPDSVALHFPLEDGRYYVAHGGSHTLVNYHHAFAPQAFALDIVGLNRWGTRARGLLPSSLQDYAIFGAPVVSPCRGEIVDVVDGLPDVPIGEQDRERPEGNHVRVRCDGLTIVLAHLQQDSIDVQAGGTVDAGAPIGRVGNSGNTTEPHLHVHATRVDAPDRGVPITFDGRFLIRNDIYTSPRDR